jgi:DNA-binding NarL/FixJ family response regulator
MYASNQLTRQERRVAVLIRRGHTNRQIAEKLVIEIGTVKRHVHNILEKTGCLRRAEVAVLLTERKRARQRERGSNMYPKIHDAGGGPG